MFEVYTFLYGHWALPFVLASVIYNAVCLLSSGKKKPHKPEIHRAYTTQQVGLLSSAHSLVAPFDLNT